MRLEDIDPNFKVDTSIEREGIKFYNAEAEPFRIHGVFREGDRFVRLPRAVADSVSPGVSNLATRLAGGRVRFITDSPYVAINAELCDKYRADHFTMCASIGLDLYIEGNGQPVYYVGTFRPPVNVENSYQSVKDLPSGEWEVTINLPLYGGLRALYIGLDENATLKPPREYTYAKPVLFYGSSITQGGCASRAGMSYEGILSRRLDFDFINLGFSGSAKGEPEIIEYLASLDPSVFVLDYDYNAPTADHLEATHEPLFKRFRAAHPTTPVIMISKPLPEIYFTEGDYRRREIIRTTYENAVAAGDKNVYFIDGATLITTESMVDRTHPTDLGFTLMADGIEPVLSEALEKSAK